MLLDVDPELARVADSEGMLPAHYAAMRNCLPLLSQFCKLLGAVGPDHMGMTPLHTCIQHVRRRFPQACWRRCWSNWQVI